MDSAVPMSRTRGTISGLALVVLGAWGGLAPLIGPYFNFGFLPDHAWHYSAGRLYLSMIPGVVVLLAGVVVGATKGRWLGGTCGFVAALGGAWFIGGQAALRVISGTSYSAGAPMAGSADRILLTNLACFAGVGALIVFFAAMALGRQSVAAHKDHLKFGDPAADDDGGTGWLADVGLASGGRGYDSYQPIGEQESTTRQSSGGTGSYETTTGQQPVVGGQARFPRQYPPTGESGPGPT